MSLGCAIFAAGPGRRPRLRPMPHRLRIAQAPFRREDASGSWPGLPPRLLTHPRSRIVYAQRRTVVARLFSAGIVPGVRLALFFMGSRSWALLNRERGRRRSLRFRSRARAASGRLIPLLLRSCVIARSMAAWRPPPRRRWCACARAALFLARVSSRRESFRESLMVSGPSRLHDFFILAGAVLSPTAWALPASRLAAEWIPGWAHSSLLAAELFYSCSAASSTASPGVIDHLGDHAARRARVLRSHLVRDLRGARVEIAR